MHHKHKSLHSQTTTNLIKREICDTFLKTKVLKQQIDKKKFEFFFHKKTILFVLFFELV